MSQPSYPGSIAATQVAERLAEASSSPTHEFWPDSISLLNMEIFNWSKILGYRQVTDIYLLSLAVRNEGRFVTFDRRITTDAESGATLEQLVCLQA
jgi:predicted nucleic acid-binding protein